MEKDMCIEYFCITLKQSFLVSTPKEDLTENTFLNTVKERKINTDNIIPKFSTKCLSTLAAHSPLSSFEENSLSLPFCYLQILLFLQ